MPHSNLRRAAIGVLYLFGPLLLAQVDPEKAVLIRKIVEAQYRDRLRTQLQNVVLGTQVTLLRQNPIYPPAYVDEVAKKAKERLDKFDLAELLLPAYAKTFSVDELKEILAFHTSPTGRKLASAQPEMLNESMRAARDWALKIGPEMSREIFEEHPEFAKEIEANKAKFQGSASAATDGAGNAYRIGGDVSAPVLISKTEPQYSAEAAKAGLDGEVLLSVVIDEKGVPQNIRVIRPLGKGLDEKAVEAVQQWRFRPGVKNGEPVKTIAQVIVNFRLLKKQ